ncbi:hypothetical protein BJ508DRAFT_301521 [Ascobolus immersus RN42]|uniref:Uncharacterized protein n=1 Tax=Ascobolus immersus RN42 TaxID=1160509 RepID=A0A3N4ILY7_ASCIM|nr:hypothetical protein BJ508DRAFT_301521 [Ascobolus immersus RN42]
MVRQNFRWPPRGLPAHKRPKIEFACDKQYSTPTAAQEIPVYNPAEVNPYQPQRTRFRDRAASIMSLSRFGRRREEKTQEEQPEYELEESEDEPAPVKEPRRLMAAEEPDGWVDAETTDPFEDGEEEVWAPALEYQEAGVARRVPREHIRSVEIGEAPRLLEPIQEEKVKTQPKKRKTAKKEVSNGEGSSKGKGRAVEERDVFDDILARQEALLESYRKQKEVSVKKAATEEKEKAVIPEVKKVEPMEQAPLPAPMPSSPVPVPETEPEAPEVDEILMRQEALLQSYKKQREDALKAAAEKEKENQGPPSKRKEKTESTIGDGSNAKEKTEPTVGETKKATTKGTPRKKGTKRKKVVEPSTSEAPITDPSVASASEPVPQPTFSSQPPTTEDPSTTKEPPANSKKKPRKTKKKPTKAPKHTPSLISTLNLEPTQSFPLDLPSGSNSAPTSIPSSSSSEYYSACSTLGSYATQTSILTPSPGAPASVASSSSRKPVRRVKAKTTRGSIKQRRPKPKPPPLGTEQCNIPPPYRIRDTDLYLVPALIRRRSGVNDNASEGTEEIVRIGDRRKRSTTMTSTVFEGEMRVEIGDAREHHDSGSSSMGVSLKASMTMASVSEGKAGPSVPVTRGKKKRKKLDMSRQPSSETNTRPPIRPRL